ncbi:MAG: putative sulfate exporter family transporter [Cardiobacteriaceae bacterium]|nr:putative sulfate exporter family transporter [Cardiobacteriaceae bacterium]
MSSSTLTLEEGAKHSDSSRERSAKAAPPPVWFKKEDSWAIIIGLGLVLAATGLFFLNSSGVLSHIVFSAPSWTSFDELASKLPTKLGSAVALYLLLLGVLTIGAQRLGYNTVRFIQGFSLLYALAVLVLIVSANKGVKSAQLETPLVALFVGLVIGNVLRLPQWFSEALRTEYYVKTGIVLMGATLPFTIILKAGPAAIGQALIVSVVTFASIYFAATRLFKLDRRFAACLGAGGSICGVSGSIAIGGACRAEKAHVSMAISLVIVWAVVMIFVLPAASRWLGLHPGVAGAWIGTSEFADAAGFAAAEAIGHEVATEAFTLMKVVGRDMFVGIWAFLVAILSVTVWEQRNAAQSERVDYREIWQRFPKFILGFFVASLITTLVITLLSADAGKAYSSESLKVLKELRGWFFTLTFLSIGLTTRFRELAAVGLKPFFAFTIGVIINLPLGYYLSNYVFDSFWRGLAP